MDDLSGGRSGRGLFQPKGAGLLHGSQHLLIQHGEGRVRWQIQPVETGMSSAATHTSSDRVRFDGKQEEANK